jgi:hypothetical protein
MNTDDLINFVSTYDPAFPTRIRGASPEEIAELERLAGLSLPPAYKNYLLRMGRNDGGFDVGGGSTTKIDALLEYYTESLDFDMEDIPPNCLVVAISGGGTFELSLEYGSDAGHPVLLTSGDTIKGLLSESFEKLLFRHAFVKYRLGSFPSSAIYWGDSNEESLKKATEVALNMSFERQWFSDRVSFCGEGGASAIVIERILDRPVWMRISGQQAAEVERLGSTFAQQAGMIFKQWWPS